MKLPTLSGDLLHQVAALAVTDAHEHLPSEAECLSCGNSGLSILAGGYIRHDLESAGMSSELRAAVRDGGERPVDTWWPQIRPHWDAVKHTSHAGALRIAVRDLFGIPGIKDSAIAAPAERVRADNTPGLYCRVVQQRCHIRCSITCVDRAECGLHSEAR